MALIMLIKPREVLKLCFLTTISLVTILLLMGSIFYLINGSLEVEPSVEQQGKATIAGWVLVFVFSWLSYFIVRKVVRGFTEFRNYQNHHLN